MESKGFKKTNIDLGEGMGALFYKWSDGTCHKTKEQKE